MPRIKGGCPRARTRRHRSPVGRHLTQVVVRSLALALLAGSGVAYVRADKTVTLVVDGETRQVQTFGRTVEAVLQAADITVGEHDVLAPAPDVAVDEESTVVVRRGR